MRAGGFSTDFAQWVLLKWGLSYDERKGTRAMGRFSVILRYQSDGLSGEFSRCLAHSIRRPMVTDAFASGVSLCQTGRDIYEHNDTRAMGRFLDIITAMCRV